MQTYYQNGTPPGFYPGVQPSYPAYYPASPLPVPPVVAPSPLPYQPNPPEQFHPELANTDQFVPQGGEEQPPEFEPYVAKYKITSSGCVVSHDPHLNEDGAWYNEYITSSS